MAYCLQANAVAAINREGNISALMHPVGFMYHEDDAVEVQTNDIRLRNHKLDKLLLKLKNNNNQIQSYNSRV